MNVAVLPSIRRMPYAMVERLSRYARSKPMIAMGLEPLVRSTVDNV